MLLSYDATVCLLVDSIPSQQIPKFTSALFRKEVYLGRTYAQSKFQILPSKKKVQPSVERSTNGKVCIWTYGQKSLSWRILSQSIPLFDSRIRWLRSNQRANEMWTKTMSLDMMRRKTNRKWYVPRIKKYRKVEFFILNLFNLRNEWSDSAALMYNFTLHYCNVTNGLYAMYCIYCTYVKTKIRCLWYMIKLKHDRKTCQIKSDIQT